MLPRRLLALGVAAAIPAAAAAQQPAAPATSQPIDSAYTAQIRELTPTDPTWKFTTELVDHLPASSTVPTPLAVLGYVPGTLGRLSHVADVNRYFRALADASPRVELFSLGASDEGREMLVAAIADEETLRRLDEHRAALARLADPRTRTPAERARLIAGTKPVYWLTGAIHSPETGSPEMLMELAYRLAVSESEPIRTIRANVITLITPVIEVDGRDRMVDAYRLSRSLKLGPRGVPLVYWGKYTAHDNNRDGMVLSQKLTRNVMKGFLHWRPVIMHDLHESVPFLYTSTGTGPYNEQFDPIVVDEWHQLAYQEIGELTKRGLPGVWTHSFYDGWAPNYMLAIANLHNAVGRFYETYTSSGAGCHTVQLPQQATRRTWDRPNPPVNGVRWCIRSNINYQQSGVLIALEYTARNARAFLENYALKAERMVRRGQAQAPYAFVIPREQRRASDAADLVNLFQRHGTEVHVASSDFTLRGPTRRVVETGHTGYDPVRRPGAGGDSAAAQPSDSARRAPGAGGDSAARGDRGGDARAVQVRAGDWIIRLDQPYTATVRTLLAEQRYDADDPRPYDDTGWTLDALWHVDVWTIRDSSVLSRPMTRLEGDARLEGAADESGPVLLVRHLGDWRSAVLPWRLRGARVSAADTAFAVGGESYPAGTYIVEGATARVRDSIRALGLRAVGATAAPSVRRHAVDLPRVALMHSWIETQNEGWVRFAFDQLGVPYAYISDQTLRRPGALDRFDVVVFPHVSAFGASVSLLNGRPMTGPPIPWRKSELTPHLGGIDETDDVRPGMGLEGAAALRRFVERGGLLITEGNSSRLPVELGFNPTVSIAGSERLSARGAIFRAQQETRTSPILSGYDRQVFPVYFNQQPLLTVQARDTTERPADLDPAIVAEGERARARVILKFVPRADSLLVSGLLANGQEMAGRAAVVDAPVGKGHVVLFGIRPMWRWESQGSFALLLNAVAHWNDLDADRREARAAEVAAGGR
jgi:hypothetical protein